MRQANRYLEQFAYSASHDLQEPLRTIKVYSELTTRRFGGQLPAQASEFLDLITGAAQRMEQLIRDLLTFTQTTQVEGPVSHTDPAVSLEKALGNLAEAIRESGAIVSAGPLP